jgi:hypothetical protein
MRTIHQIADRLNLSEQELRDLLDHGRLDGATLDPQILALARAAIIAAARAAPSKTRH